MWSFLVKNCHQPKHLDKDTRVIPAIKAQQTTYAESIKNQGLLKNKLISRSESKQCLEAIKNDNLIVFIHGASGCGKSLILYELTQMLAQEEILFFPVRLDRVGISECTNSKSFGKIFNLPDSPVFCLSANTGNKLSVLIIDQLDAIRWSRVHSNQALDMCMEVVREAISMNRNDRMVAVIISCRTFDYTNDPQIKNWIDNQKAHKIEVSGFLEDDVKQIIGETNYAVFSEKQKKMLAIPQYLKLWDEIKPTGEEQKTLQTSNQLIEAAWNYYRKKMENERGIQGSDIIGMNNKLVSYLDENSSIYAPKRIIDIFSQKTQEAFFSYGILEENHGIVLYTHQSYLDFFIARKTLDEVNTGKSILEWLGKRKCQFLPRRRQLQQVLFLLKEENPTRFEEEVIRIIESDEVRFMLKHVSLAVLSELENISDALLTFLIDKLNDSIFRSHIINTVFWGKALYIKKLIEKGILYQWLISSDEIEKNTAMNMLRSISHAIPHEVYMLLAPHLLENDEWNQRTLNSLPWKSEDDSEELFQLRFTLLKNGIYTRNTFYGLYKMAEMNPDRCLQLLDVILASWRYNPERYEIEKGIKDDFWHENIDKKVSAMAHSIPGQVWDVLIPHLQRLTETKTYVPYDWDDDGDSNHPSLIKTCIRMIKMAAHVIVGNDHEDLLKRLQKMESTKSVVINNLFKKCLYLLPNGDADYCIIWFLADLTRLKTEQREGNEWELAARCIGKHSCFCSESIFLKLERKIITFYDKTNDMGFMKESLKWRLEGTLYLYGEPQYFLLPALDPNRRSNGINQVIEVLKRRFKGAPDHFLRRSPRFRSGWVDSKLAPNINKISDRTWLNIVCKRSSSFTNRHQNARQAGPDTILESSVEQFSRSLEQVASQQPFRFSKLAIQFPEETDHAYITAIYSAMSQTKVPEKMPEELKKDWQPAPINLIIEFINKFPPIDEINQAHTFCWLIRDRSEEQWPLEILAYIKKYAESHPDPGAGVECNSVSDLQRVAINHTRGVAATAIGALLFHHYDLFNFFRPTIEKLITDFHPAVRTTVCSIILPLYNIDKEIAVNFYQKNIEIDPRIAINRESIYFLNYTIREYYEKLRPLILSIYESANPELQENAGKAIAGYNLFYDLFEDLIHNCLHATASVRKGMASIYCAQIFEEKYTQECTNYLSLLFNDSDKEVRQEASRLCIIILPIILILVSCYRTLSILLHLQSMFLNCYGFSNKNISAPCSRFTI